MMEGSDDPDRLDEDSIKQLCQRLLALKESGAGLVVSSTFICLTGDAELLMLGSCN